LEQAKGPKQNHYFDLVTNVPLSRFTTNVCSEEIAKLHNTKLHRENSVYITLNETF